MEIIIRMVLGVTSIPVLFFVFCIVRGKYGRGSLVATHGLSVVRTILSTSLLLSVGWYVVTGTHISRDFQLQLPDSLRAAGLISVGLGLLLRLWAHRALQHYWSADISVRADHVLIQSGPYYWCYHPIYVSYLPVSCGLLFATNNLLIGGLGVTAAIVSFLRIPTEESLLHEHFGIAYQDYKNAILDRWAMLATGTLVLSSCIGGAWEIAGIFRLI